ncbi:MAG: ImmA/IrrE family metallo-endopeptidase [Liquorilactobacillus ghanensis]|jgi:Zn-dependent peptidase ImmA (M78 family)|uniref:IrrE N-terminal-like domain-containing protein n=1 Tax=Liquorilactobacillus ghanensis DSM 18630 TaxID=1423750 RepID=A0A0R1VQD6_9LACO|nr:ImmA/IrrE family metallo-endopeptidase [Liquorilactobacillus ghanensis]KRM07653.1 hypothetical protein FC89_GL000092 [Liquorilactobacillus ghanensis DSM 18630]
MNELLIQLTQLAHKKEISVYWITSLTPEAPSIASADQRIIIMNQNWKKPHELIFQFAHELAHLLRNESSDQILYRTTTAQLLSIEHQTNQLAINLLIPFYLKQVTTHTINSQEFIQSFGIPQRYQELVKQELTAYLINHPQ